MALPSPKSGMCNWGLTSNINVIENLDRWKQKIVKSIRIPRTLKAVLAECGYDGKRSFKDRLSCHSQYQDLKQYVQWNFAGG